MEINNFNETQRNVKLVVSVRWTELRTDDPQEMEYIPSSTFIPAWATLLTDNQAVRLKMGHGSATCASLGMTGFAGQVRTRRASVVDRTGRQGNELDAAKQQFGMRSFDGHRFGAARAQHLNGEQIRLREPTRWGTCSSA